MDFSPERLDTSAQAMKIKYPSFSVSGLPIGTGPIAIWKGWIQPIRNRESLELLLSDLANNHPVRVLHSGEIIHKPDCKNQHESLPWLKKLKKPDAAYKLKVTYNGGTQHPKAFIIEPLKHLRELRHIFRDGSICAYPPWEDIWHWQYSTVADFMDHISIWLLKNTVWQQVGLWIGDEMPHNTEFLYNTIKPFEECWCRSGQLYGMCHRESDQNTLSKLRMVTAIRNNKLTLPFSLKSSSKS